MIGDLTTPNVYFERQPINGFASRWEAMSVCEHSVHFGWVEWHGPPSMAYLFRVDTPQKIFNHETLRDIADFVEMINRQSKEERRNAKEAKRKT